MIVLQEKEQLLRQRRSLGTVSKNPVRAGVVYFLFSGEEVVYVGQTTRIEARVVEHFRAGIIVFDSFAALAVEDAGERAKLEAAYIRAFSPPNNGILYEMLPRHPTFSLELTPGRRRLWQRAANKVVPDRQRNLRAWMIPLLDVAADLQLTGKDPAEILRAEQKGEKP